MSENKTIHCKLLQWLHESVLSRFILAKQTVLAFTHTESIQTLCIDQYVCPIIRSVLITWLRLMFNCITRTCFSIRLNTVKQYTDWELAYNFNGIVRHINWTDSDGYLHKLNVEWWYIFLFNVYFKQYPYTAYVFWIIIYNEIINSLYTILETVRQDNPMRDRSFLRWWISKPKSSGLWRRAV